MNENDLLVILICTIVRAAAFVTTMPLSGVVPRLVKVGLVCGLSVAFLPELSDARPVAWGESGWIGLVLLGLRESLIGGVLGFCFGILLEPIKVAGSYLDQQIGLSFGAAVDPLVNQSASITGQILEPMAILVLFILDVHHIMFAALFRSFQIVDWGDPLAVSVLGASIRQATRIPETGMMLAFPVGLLLFVSTVFSSLLMRVAPQFNFFSVAFTLRIGVGLLGLYLMFPEFVGMCTRMLAHSEGLAEEILRAFD
jgi:flagellar biosynthesis protein FliR